MKLSGIVFNNQGVISDSRIVGIGKELSFLNEAAVKQNGHWSLEVMKPVKWIIAQLSGRQLAAVAARPTDSSSIEMPDMVRLQFRVEEAIYGTALWLDPVALEGFPKPLLWALRRHPNHIARLHLAEFPMFDGEWELDVQRGKYRLSGGQIAIHPTTETILLSNVINEKTGASWQAVDGEVIVDVCEPTTLRVCFASAADDKQFYLGTYRDFGASDGELQTVLPLHLGL